MFVRVNSKTISVRNNFQGNILTELVCSKKFGPHKITIVTDPVEV